MTKRFRRAACIIFAMLIILTTLPFTSASALDSSQTTMANLVIFVKFSGDTSDTLNSNNNIQRLIGYYDYNPDVYDLGLDTSFKNYISTISRGKLNIENYFPQYSDGTVNTLTLPYSSSSGVSDDEILVSVVAAINNGTINIGNRKYDNINAGTIDNMTVIFQHDSAPDSDDDVLHSHKSTASQTLMVNGKYNVFNYNFLTTYVVLHDSVSLQGVITHEFLHSVGFPDLYRYDGTGTPVGIWDIMASAGTYMQYPLSYMRHLQGWVPMQEITSSGHYTLNAVTAEDGTAVFKLSTAMSDTEFFCIEYRQKKTDTVAGLGYETKIPSSGLLVYRVNTSLEYLNNKLSDQDYIYIFRPDDTSAHASEGSIRDAAINPDEGETSYGVADLSAGISQNTIFYSGGENSGIVLSNISYSQDKSQISFDVDIPDYSSLGLWKKNGAPLMSSAADMLNITEAPDGSIYTAVSSSSGDFNITYSVNVHKTLGSVRTKCGSTITDAYSANAFCFNGEVYVSYVTAESGAARVVKLVNGVWEQVMITEDSLYPSSLSLLADGEDLYFAFVSNNTVYIYQLNGTPELIDNNLFADSGFFANPYFEVYNGEIYALYSVMWETTPVNGAELKKYNPISGIWSDVSVIGTDDTVTNKLAVSNGKLYTLVGGNAKPVILGTYDGTTLSTETLNFGQAIYTGLSLAVSGEDVLVSVITDETAKVYTNADGEWKKLGFDVAAAALDISLAAHGNRVFALTSSASGVNLTSKSIHAPALSLADGSTARIETEIKYLVIPRLCTSLENLFNVSFGGTLVPDEGFLGTRTRARLVDADDDTTATYCVIVLGDLNSDSAVDAIDTAHADLIFNGFSVPDAVDTYAADIVSDDRIDINDITQIVNLSVGIE